MNYKLMIIFALSFSFIKRDLNDNVTQTDSTNCYNISGIKGFLVLDDDKLAHNNSYNILDADYKTHASVVIDNEKQYPVYRLITQNEQYFEIKGDDDQVYYIKKDSPFKLISFGDFWINAVFSVGNNFVENPLVKEDFKEVISFEESPSNFRIEPLKVQGDWLQIKYENFEIGKETIGWIKWKKNECIIIEFFFFA